MLKKFKKKSLKVKIAIIALIVILLALVAYVLYANFKPEPPAAYDVAAVAYGSVTDTLDVNGTVESGVSEHFTAVDGVTVEEVLVNVGDRVEKGQKLATFDTSGASAYLSQAKKEYNDALQEYNNLIKSQNATASRKAELNSQIDAKNKQISAKKNEVAALEKEIENIQPVTEQVKIPQEQIDAIAAQMAQNGASEEEIQQFKATASQLTVPVTTVDTSKSEELINKNLELAQLNTELTALQAENTVTISTNNDTAAKALKSVAESKKATYDNIKAVFDKMNNGWYADNSGIVTVVNIKPGEKFVPVKEDNGSTLDIASLLGGQNIDSDTLTLINSLLGSSQTVPTGVGMTVESYNDLVVTVTVGKSDLLKIKTGMEAVITSVNKEYSGEVIYVSATASESAGLDIGSITSSLMGGSGGSNGAVVKIKIKDPDEKIVIGFDVDIKINLNKIENVLTAPVEAVMYDGTSQEYFVYIYDSETKTVTRRTVTRGILDDVSYQITDGLKEGEIVVKSPDPNMTDGTKIREKTA